MVGLLWRDATGLQLLHICLKPSGSAGAATKPCVREVSTPTAAVSICCCGRSVSGGLDCSQCVE
jgi:hypothetical protein